jgi:hypothetical protein
LQQLAEVNPFFWVFFPFFAVYKYTDLPMRKQQGKKAVEKKVVEKKAAVAVHLRLRIKQVC